jgi:TRAP-type C4-dicarboxylate transport system permease large subunit
VPSAGRSDPVCRLRSGKVTIEQVMRRIWPFYAVMFLVLMLVTYIPEISVWLPGRVLR